MKAARTLRLFVALWPDDATRAALVRCRDAWAWGPAAAPEPAARLHLTLHFLGAVPAARLPELRAGLHLPRQPFTLCLDRPARWPNGAAVLTPSVVPPALAALHAALGERLERLGLAIETRTFRPHVTLGRRAGDARSPVLIDPVRWPVQGHVLVASRPPPQEHLVLHAFT